jgi:hypothetical protein
MMPRLRSALGLLSGVLLILSSAAHSLMGWPALHTQLAATTAPADLVTGLALGWHFGGAAQLAMGIVVLHIFLGRLRALARSRFPAQVIGAMYLAFGCYAWVIARNPFFIGVFVVPGILLLVASLGADGTIAARPEDRI